METETTTGPDESITAETKRIQKIMEDREQLIDELNLLVTTLGPRFLHRGMTMNEGFHAIIDCLKSMEQKLHDAEEKLKRLSEQTSCVEPEGVPV